MNCTSHPQSMTSWSYFDLLHSVNVYDHNVVEHKKTDVINRMVVHLATEGCNSDLYTCRNFAREYLQCLDTHGTDPFAPAHQPCCEHYRNARHMCEKYNWEATSAEDIDNGMWPAPHDFTTSLEAAVGFSMECGVLTKGKQSDECQNARMQAEGCLDMHGKWSMHSDRVPDDFEGA